MEQRPARIHPEFASRQGRITTFRDGPRLVPEYLAGFLTADSYPDLGYQQWVSTVANKQLESQVVGRAIGLLRNRNFMQR